MQQNRPGAHKEKGLHGVQRSRHELGQTSRAPKEQRAAQTRYVVATTPIAMPARTEPKRASWPSQQER